MRDVERRKMFTALCQDIEPTVQAPVPALVQKPSKGKEDADKLASSLTFVLDQKKQKPKQEAGLTEKEIAQLYSQQRKENQKFTATIDLDKILLSPRAKAPNQKLQDGLGDSKLPAEKNEETKSQLKPQQTTFNKSFSIQSFGNPKVETSND